MTDTGKDLYYRKCSANGCFGSMCLVCFVTIAYAWDEIELAVLERDHVCEPAFLAERGVLTSRWIS
jgi:hypothetical protein